MDRRSNPWLAVGGGWLGGRADRQPARLRAEVPACGWAHRWCRWFGTQMGRFAGGFVESPDGLGRSGWGCRWCRWVGTQTWADAGGIVEMIDGLGRKRRCVWGISAAGVTNQGARHWAMADFACYDATRQWPMSADCEMWITGASVHRGHQDWCRRRRHM